MNLYAEPLSVTHPEIAAEWSDRNAFSPDDVTAGAHDKVWWKGKKCGHEWDEIINNRTSNTTGCPYCSSHRLLKGFNDFATVHPELVSEWSDKNGDLKPDEVSPFSSKKVWWCCKNGHEWLSTPHGRSSGNGCRICSNKLVLKGYNDLASKRPDIAAEWSDRNLPVTPDSIIWRKHKIYWWKCIVCGNEWKAWLSRRIELESGCPYCAGYKVAKGYNDLATTDPEIAKDWDYEANGDFTPDSIYRSSLLFVQWKCKEGHSYGMKIADRTISGRNCSICDMRFKAAFPELLLMQIAQSCGIKFEIGTKNTELFFPDLKIAFEAEGVSYPKKESQQEKKNKLYQKGITLYIMHRADDLKKAEQNVRYILKKHGITASIKREDIEKVKKSFFGEAYTEEYKGGGKFRDVPGVKHYKSDASLIPLPETDPELCKEWSEKNFPFKPEDENGKSSSKVWWKCSICGYEWKGIIRNRAYTHKGCPACAGKVVIQGFNDLSTTHPELIKEWSPKNELKPEEVTKGCSRLVLWRCSKGHEWKALTSNRVRGNPCPICARVPVIKGINDLKTTNPEILKMWSDKNVIKPEEIRATYKKQVWWICSVCGNEFLAQPHSIIQRKRPGCKRCAVDVGIGWKDLMNKDELIKEEYR